MKTGLFSSGGLQSDSAEQRLQALSALKPDDPGNRAILTALIDDDPERSVRQAALNKLGDPKLLLRFSLTHTDTGTRDDAGLALAAVLADEQRLDEKRARSLLAENKQFAAPLAKHCWHELLRTEIVNTLSEDELAEIIADIGYLETRVLIAEKLESEAALQRARNLLKGRDKSAERIIRGKLDFKHEQQRQRIDNEQAAELICGKMENLADQEWRHDSRAQFAVWSQRWAALQLTPADSLVQRYNKAAAMVEKIVAQESLIETVHQKQESLADRLEQHCVDLAKLSKSQLLAGQSEIGQALDEARKKWSPLTGTDSAEKNVAAKFSLAENTLSSALEFCVAIDGNPGQDFNNLQRGLAALRWPDNYPALSAAQEVQAEIDNLKAEQRQKKQDEAQQLDKLHKRINRLLGSTKQGNLKRAIRELAAVTKATERYSGRDRKILDERLVQAGETVEKMRDWVNFATEPKFVELCEAMEALIGAKLHADNLAKQISGLQQNWKALGHSDSADKHWERFKVAADKAYQPCEDFFQQRRELRQRNLEKREPLIEAMRELLEDTDWDGTPDYKEVEGELSRIHSEWQKSKDVERAAGQRLWKRISKLRSAVYEKLDDVYDANIDRKNQLIEKVTAMLNGEIKEDSLAKLQLYQNRWKQVGVTRRKQDQAAWKKFKKTADAVYKKIQQLRKAKRADEDAQLQAYRQISRQIQQLAKSATDLTAADADFDKLQADYGALPALPGNLPEKLVKALANDYRRACDAYAKARQRIKRAARSKIMDALVGKARLCADLERAGADGPAKKIKQLQQALAEIEIGDKELDRRIEERIAAALEPERADANQRRQLLCIDMEILLGVDSPAEDAALRMQVQLERMKKHGIGQGQGLSQKDFEQLQIEWLCLPGAEPDIQQQLEKRFQDLIKKRC